MGSRDIHTVMGSPNYSGYEREGDDYYATNPTAIDDLFRYEKFDKSIWECACGGGHLSEKMKLYGKDVYSTDLVDRGYGMGGVNFLEETKNFNGDIITNPPYKLADKFVYKGMELTKNKLAMFLKLTFLESVGRIPLFEKYPPKRVYVYTFRKSIARGGKQEFFDKSSAIAYCWFIWEKGFNGHPEIRWIKPTTQQSLDKGDK